jgi:photosystem II stability/assembly factor-like uncharacterized protein
VTPPGLSHAGRRLTTNINAADFVGPERAWIAYGPYGPPEGPQTLLTTSDGGRTWTRAGRAPRNCDLQFVNPVDGWSVGIGGAAGSEFVTIYRTTTGGRTWRRASSNGTSPTPDPIPFACDKSVTFTSPTDGFAASICNGGGGYIYATSDGGSRWQRRLSLRSPVGGSDGAGFTAVVAHGSDAAAGYTVQGYQTTPTTTVVYRSTDGGRRWTAVQPPGHPRGYQVSVVTPRVWRLVAGETVLSTDDAGRTWSRITANLPPGRPARPTGSRWSGRSGPLGGGREARYSLGELSVSRVPLRCGRVFGLPRQLRRRIDLKRRCVVSHRCVYRGMARNQIGDPGNAVGDD